MRLWDIVFLGGGGRGLAARGKTSELKRLKTHLPDLYIHSCKVKLNTLFQQVPAVYTLTSRSSNESPVSKPCHTTRDQSMLLGCVSARGDAGQLLRVHRRHPQGHGPHLRSYGKCTFRSLLIRSRIYIRRRYLK